MLMDRDLLGATTQTDGGIEVFNASINAHGLYNSFQFVLRLSPEIHRRLQSVKGGIYNFGQLDFNVLQAFSTYLHETIHWWQHIGSTSGFLLSLTYPTQTHVNYSHLRALIDSFGAQKPIIQIAKTLPASGYGRSPERQILLLIIIMI